MGIVEVAASGIMLLLFYRVLSINLGATTLGLWSLIISATALIRMADPGMASSAARFVALARSSEQPNAERVYVITGTLLNVALYGGLGVLLLHPVQILVSLALPAPSEQASGRALVPAALALVVLSSVSSTVLGVIVGQQRFGLKSLIVIVAAMVQIAFAIWLVPSFGISGAVAAQGINYATIIVAGLVLSLRAIPRSPAKWSAREYTSAAREILSFSVKIQATNIISAPFEPAIKLLIARFGDLGSVALFEIAQRIILQARQFIVVPNQALIPKFVETISEPRVAQIYARSFTLQLVLSGLMLLAVVSVAPLLVSLTLNRPIDASTVLMVAALGVAWALNTLCVPAYLLGVARAELGPNMFGHALTLGLTIAGGLGLARATGTSGIIMASLVGLTAGSFLSAMVNCQRAGVNFVGLDLSFQSFREAARALKRGG